MQQQQQQQRGAAHQSFRTTASMLPAAPLASGAASASAASFARAQALKKRAALLTKSPADAMLSPTSLHLQSRRTRGRRRPTEQDLRCVVVPLRLARSLAPHSRAAPPSLSLCLSSPIRRVPTEAMAEVTIAPPQFRSLAAFSFSSVASSSFTIPPPPPTPPPAQQDEENAVVKSRSRAPSTHNTPRRGSTPSRAKSFASGAAVRSARKQRALTPRTNTPRRRACAADGAGKTLLSFSLGGHNGVGALKSKSLSKVSTPKLARKHSGTPGRTPRSKGLSLRRSSSMQSAGRQERVATPMRV